MTNLWFDDPNQFGALFGAIVGGGGGTLLGLIGAAMGYFLPRGRGQKTFIGLGVLGALFGAVCLGLGVIALGMKQPYAIWFPLVLTGILIGVLCSGMVLLVAMLSRTIEQRKMQARDLREI